MRMLIPSLLVLAVALLPSLGFAADKGPRVNGAIESLTDTGFVVMPKVNKKNPDPVAVTVVVEDGTKIKLNKEEATIDDLQEGDQVNVRGTNDDDGNLVAKSVTATRVEDDDGGDDGEDFDQQ